VYQQDSTTLPKISTSFFSPHMQEKICAQSFVKSPECNLGDPEWPPEMDIRE
jgi:hypothetical protein